MYVELHATLFLRAPAFLQQHNKENPQKILSAQNLVVVKNLSVPFLHLFYKTEEAQQTHTNTHTNI